MKNDDMNGYMAYLFRATMKTLVDKEIISKGEEGARMVNLTYDQYKNICSERTPIMPKQWESFIKTLKDTDDHEYQWVLKKLTGD